MTESKATSPAALSPDSNVSAAKKKRPYQAPAIQGEDTFERHALQACGGKDGSCGPFLTS